MQWYICHPDEHVEGPLSTEQVQKSVKAESVRDHWMIWARVSSHWMTIAQWQENLEHLLATETKPKESQVWHFVANNESYGPFLRSELIEKLGEYDDDTKYKVLLWTQGMTSWVPVFEFHDILDALNINRRNHPRAPLTGQVVTSYEGATHVGQLVSISQGGCGMIGVNVKPGDELQLEIKSPELYETVSAKAEVRYKAESGYVGLKFKHISMENQSAIIAYVKNKLSPQKAA